MLIFIVFARVLLDCCSTTRYLSDGCLTARFISIYHWCHYRCRLFPFRIFVEQTIESNGMDRRMRKYEQMKIDENDEEWKAFQSEWLRRKSEKKQQKCENRKTVSPHIVSSTHTHARTAHNTPQWLDLLLSVSINYDYLNDDGDIIFSTIFFDCFHKSLLVRCVSESLCFAGCSVIVCAIALFWYALTIVMWLRVCVAENLTMVVMDLFLNAGGSRMKLQEWQTPSTTDFAYCVPFGTLPCVPATYIRHCIRIVVCVVIPKREKVFAMLTFSI